MCSGRFSVAYRRVKTVKKKNEMSNHQPLQWSSSAARGRLTLNDLQINFTVLETEVVACGRLSRSEARLYKAYQMVKKG